MARVRVASAPPLTKNLPMPRRWFLKGAKQRLPVLMMHDIDGEETTDKFMAWYVTVMLPSGQPTTAEVWNHDIIFNGGN